jgi:hypothetical protein
LRFLIVKQFDEQQYTKLEQAGSTADTRPGIHRLFIDLPFRANEYNLEGFVTEYLVHTAAKSHRIDRKQPTSEEWRVWSRHPSRARIWFVRGGPGQGKSTIGQYFCQVQRACLILQEDGPTVPAQQKNTAEEIREAAKKAGFWPSVPRIPISIELKDFAQWFGQRDRNLARGILTYLTERISAGVEQKVLVGTLRRALGSRSWVVVFDGLDEVPHDVKDAVASEVCNFVDNIVPETSADLLTICTSRPQGYSGQFSNLDGPTIDLITLSPDRALQCARPVIELGRTQDEARKAISTLESAIQSGSVRELITTPLQAHIMAVVVRDGGKPPERRCQLFTNFYQVIRRREANRDLPDRKLAKLLREDEKLLKAVHNRLGFILHARAETSKGAQTHFRRDEFKTLLTDIVSQMVEADIDNTVDVLMQATTNRLVLVSTPDDGDHVRFDIRQLQEFFAAEFLYELVPVEMLRQRLEIIAGDSHWREVMHFLMSALVENGRQTELSVAIDVLERLDGAGYDDNVGERLLYRRLSRGSLLAAQLLRDGVLEQDKRDRQQFRKCFEPLLGLTDVGVLQPLISATQPNSQSWLLDFLITSLREVSPQENIGASLILARVLCDGDSRVKTFREYLASSAQEYISSIIVSMDKNRFSRDGRGQIEITYQKWFIEMILGVLTCPQWYLLDSSAIGSAVSILRRNKEQAYAIAEEFNFSSDLIEILKGLLENTNENDDGIIRKDYGFAKATFHKYNWLSRDFLFRSWRNELPGEIPQDRGILSLISKILKFGLTKSESDLELLITDIEEIGLDHLRFLPSGIRAYLPINGYTLQRNLSDERRAEVIRDNIREMLNTGTGLGDFVKDIDFTVEGGLTIDQWKEIIKDYPDLAVFMWFEDIIERFMNTLRLMYEEEGRRIFADLILRIPDELDEYMLFWGKVLNGMEGYEEELREVLLREYRLNLNRSLMRHRELKPFKMRLPREAIWLARLLIDVIEYVPTQNLREDDKKTLDEIRRIIRKYNINTKSLCEVIMNRTTSPDIRRCAAIMLWIMRGLGRLTEAEKQVICGPTGEENDVWVTRIVGSLLGIVLTESLDKRENIIPIVMWLLERTRARFMIRQYLERPLGIWREIAEAPVQREDVLESWLKNS